MVIVTHESYDSVLVGTGKQNGLVSLSGNASDGADATWRDRSFQTAAPETGNARLPTVERRTGGTSRRCDCLRYRAMADDQTLSGVSPG